jgi:hypothetical protein
LTGSTNWTSLSELLGFSIWTTGVSSLLGVISVVTKDDVDWSSSAEGILESVSASEYQRQSWWTHRQGSSCKDCLKNRSHNKVIDQPPYISCVWCWPKHWLVFFFYTSSARDIGLVFVHVE